MSDRPSRSTEVAPNPRSNLCRAEGRSVAAGGRKLEEDDPRHGHADDIPLAKVETADGLVREEDVGREPAARVPAPEQPRHVRGAQPIREVVPGAVRGEIEGAKADEAGRLERRGKNQGQRQPSDDERPAGTRGLEENQGMRGAAASYHASITAPRPRVNQLGPGVLQDVQARTAVDVMAPSAPGVEVRMPFQRNDRWRARTRRRAGRRLKEQIKL